MELSYQQICEIVAKHLERAKALMDEPFGPDDGKRPFDDEASLKEYVQGLDDVRTDIQVEITTGTYRRVKENAISLLNEFGVSIDDIDEDRVMG